MIETSMIEITQRSPLEKRQEVLSFAIDRAMVIYAFWLDIKRFQTHAQNFILFFMR